MKNVYFLLLSLLLFVSSCTLVTFSEAQKHFSAGATMVNAELLGIDLSEQAVGLNGLYSSAEMPEQTAPNARSQFLVAREKLTKTLKKDKRLEEDGVLANAHTLLALTQWQLGDYEAARIQAELAKAAFSQQNTAPAHSAHIGAQAKNSRDLAMAYAVEELIVINQLHDSIQVLRNLLRVPPTDSLATTRRISRFMQEYILAARKGSLLPALQGLDAATAKAASHTATLLYIRCAQLAALQNYRALFDHFDKAGKDSRAFIRDEELSQSYTLSANTLEALVENYRLQLLTLLGNNTEHPLYRFWKGKVYL